MRAVRHGPGSEAARPDNRLKPNEFRDVRVGYPEGASRAQVSILFKPYPLMADEDAFVLGTWGSED